MSRRMDNMVIAIDGPSGAGKSTVARVLADRLGYMYVDTGAMYRAVALKAKQAALKTEDEGSLRALCQSLDIQFCPGRTGMRVVCDGEDVTEAIRRPEMSLLASDISKVPVVREAMVGLQRKLAGKGRAVFEGRDIGTVVFPDAPLKFFIDADPQTRGRRRYEELKMRGEAVGLDETIRESGRRDLSDRTRALAPLKKAADAVYIDTTHLTIEQVVDQMMRIYRDRMEEWKRSGRDK
jgi:cytidylate kinase